MGVFQPDPVRERIELANEPEFNLGGMTVRPAERLVFVNDERRELQPRVMQVLVALAKARPKVVPRDRLLDLCWDGRVVGDDALNRCILALRQLAQQFTPQPFAIETVARVGHRLVEGTDKSAAAPQPPKAKPWRGVVPLMALALMGTVGLILWQQRGAPPPTILVTAAANDDASRALARELAVKLGGLATAHSSSIRLISEAGSPEQPDLIMEVGHTDVAASVAIKSARDRAILWSKEFAQPSRNLSDLKQQIAATAAQVLGCAIEGMESSVRLDEQTLKLYVTGCAQVADVGARDLQSVIAVFRQVIDKAPRFKSAWAKLLLAESKATLAERDAPLPERQAALTAGKVETRSKLRQDIVRARELQPDMTEALLAESAMLPSNAYGETLRLLDRAKQSSPENASVLEFRAAALMKVGRWSHAIADSKRAAELSPLSPSAISSYALTLAYAGRIDAARTELERAERLWPRTQALRELQYSFHWHFGDPMLALKLTPPGLPKGREMYLRARAEPSEAKIEQFLSFIRALYSRQERTDVGRGVLQQFAALHREDELYEWLLGPRGQGLSASSEVLFRPALKTFRQDPRFMILAKRAGLLDYWRRSGKWPDFCSEEELPYDCKTEAAKYAPLR